MNTYLNISTAFMPWSQAVPPAAGRMVFFMHFQALSTLVNLSLHNNTLFLGIQIDSEVSSAPPHPSLMECTAFQTLIRPAVEVRRST